MPTTRIADDQRVVSRAPTATRRVALRTYQVPVAGLELAFAALCSLVVYLCTRSRLDPVTVTTMSAAPLATIGTAVSVRLRSTLRADGAGVTLYHGHQRRTYPWSVVRGVVAHERIGRTRLGVQLDNGAMALIHPGPLARSWHHICMAIASCAPEDQPVLMIERHGPWGAVRTVNLVDPPA